MGEIRYVGPGKTRGYPYPVCKNIYSAYFISQGCIFHLAIRLILPIINICIITNNFFLFQPFLGATADKNFFSQCKNVFDFFFTIFYSGKSIHIYINTENIQWD